MLVDPLLSVLILMEQTDFQVTFLLNLRVKHLA